MTFEALSADEIAKREKALAEAYDKASKAAKADPSVPAPRKPTITVIEKAVATKAKAEALAASARQKYEESLKANKAN
ncbi:MAG TPA: hypothetical protein PLE19_21310 [Planctomycetota bacterium]|nr:hypothetical protein [Planctomycetota bacterium]HRR83022.1 hypothetical protein [Planctomycetota bacterium]HRT97277.1 hypothetical protein [Planctomycetota bacterium]